MPSCLPKIQTKSCQMNLEGKVKCFPQNKRSIHWNYSPQHCNRQTTVTTAAYFWNIDTFLLHDIPTTDGKNSHELQICTSHL